MYYNAKAPLFPRIERLFRTWRLSQRLHPVNVLIKNWSQLYKKNDFNSESESEIYKINWENPSLLCIEMGVLKKPSLKLSVSLVYEKSQKPLQFICMTELSELRNCMTSFILIHINIIMDRTLLLLVPWWSHQSMSGRMELLRKLHKAPPEHRHEEC